MMVMYITNSNQVVCWGNDDMCKEYINQRYSINSGNMYYLEYDMDNKHSYLYEDYEVYNIRNTDIYLTLGEIKMIKNGCIEETKGIKYIEEELEHLMNQRHIFSDDVIDELRYMRNYMNKLFNIYANYNTENLFMNLDLDALTSSYQMERENNGLPTVYIQ